ncbi:MAG TPA: metallophosphoesterase [Polyangiaceae bacterium]|nr:metallophosphoesterase [Polyangiaceae bacterium]
MRIAHLSDLHLLEANLERRSLRDRIRLGYLSLFRPIDVAARMRRARRALEEAQRVGFDHLVISGDLTEDGTQPQFEQLAFVLAESRIDPLKVTLVPGNHDAYCDRTGFARALDGPLRPFASASGGIPGKVIDLGEAVLLPISTAIHQHWAYSSGHIDGASYEGIDKRASDPGLAKRAIIVVQHHAPMRHPIAAMQWVDGLRGYHRLLALLAKLRGVQVLHGHLHTAVTRVLELGGITRIFGAPAVVEDDEPRVRVYETRGGIIVAA